MAITLSHQSALDAIRTIRCEGLNTHEMDAVSLAMPSPWVGKRMSMKNFDSDLWRWQRPAPDSPLHVLVPADRVRIRGRSFAAHTVPSNMPANSILWLDEHSSVACPELLFLQMAESFSLPALVMLGLELCGHFSRDARAPFTGTVADNIPAATSVENIEKYLAQLKKTKGLLKAREALRYVGDHAISVPEAVLATMFGLPSAEGGYGMGPVLLNERVRVADSGYWKRVGSRYPDLMFGFAPVGLNYDGSKHFDISGIMQAAEDYARAEPETCRKARMALRKKLEEVREKVVDDNMRDRQLVAEGRIVLSVTKEDLETGSHLDALARQVLSCAHNVCGVGVDQQLRELDDTDLKRERWDLLSSLMSRGRFGASSYGKM